MIRPLGMLGVFAAGVVVGAFAMRFAPTPAVDHDAVAAAATAPSTAPAKSIVAPGLEASAARGAPTRVAESAAATENAAATPAIAVQETSQPMVATGFIQPIDAGEAFNKLLARPSQPGFEKNEIGDAHRALEREMRDEGWAYTMEAELQNSMLNEISTGAFKLEQIECRATMCEVRLSATGAQSAAIKSWHEGLMAQPAGQRLFMNYSSSISTNDRTDMLMIFRKPPPPDPTKPAPLRVAPQKRLAAG